MVDVSLRVDLEQELYTALLVAANESGMTVSDFANGVVKTYLETNFTDVGAS